MPYPRKPKAQRKEIMIRFRATAEQKQLFEAAAHESGLDVSAWLRSISVREAKQASLRNRKLLTSE